jgi:hypothetical protein
MPKNFRRGPLPLCHTTALRIVYSTQLMVGTVTNTCYDKGRFGEPSFVSIAVELLIPLQAQWLPALQSRKLEVMA